MANLTPQVISLVSLGIAAFSALTAALAALIAFRQSRVTKEKLRLDLYNRRFEIYSCVLDFYHALLSWDASESAKSLRNRFIKSFRESLFLFDRDSGIYDLLSEMDTRSAKIIGLKEHGADLAQCPEEYQNFYRDGQTALDWFPAGIQQLEEKLGRYLNFHRLSA